MLFEFTPTIKASIEAGKYTQICSNAITIGIARDISTGHNFAHAINVLVEEHPLLPIFVPVQFLVIGINMVQNHIAWPKMYQQSGLLQTALKALQTNVEVLQATTPLIELGKTSNVALEAVNLHQILKLRTEVEQTRFDVKNGFIDLQPVLKHQSLEIRQILKETADDQEFTAHRTVLAQAYGLFIQALNRLRSALQLNDHSRRNTEIDHAREMLLEALAHYMNPLLLEQTSAPGRLRRFECAWAVEQAIVITYQVQHEILAVSDRLSHLRDKIKEQVCAVINNCESYDDLNFLFPEISRICKHDLAILEIWQARVDWIRSLSAVERQFLASSDSNPLELIDHLNHHQAIAAQSLPPEQIAYDNLAEKSHFYSLLDQLIFMFKPALRQEYEVYINQQAHLAGHKILVPRNLQQASNLTVANLYYYFKVRDELYTENTEVIEPMTA